MRPIITMLRNAGAKEVHIRVASPPLKYPVRQRRALCLAPPCQLVELP